MAYDRYDSRRGGRDPRSRFASDMGERSRDRSMDRGYDRDDRDERGFFERAGDEISSWFGDEEASRRRQIDNRYDDDERSNWMGDDDQPRFERQARYRDEGYRRPYTGRFDRLEPRGRSATDYRPMTGDYGRSSPVSREDRFERESRSTGMTSASSSRPNDPHYSEWRQRQIDSLDRDYEDYRRENQSKFDSEFSQWRSTRQGKRQLLGTVREHMTVVGSDNEQVGTVDKVRGDRIILTRNDSEDGQHHSLNCSLIDRVEGDQVILDKPAARAKEQFSNENRDRALFERDDNREPGPHMLNRSFSGTY